MSIIVQCKFCNKPFSSLGGKVCNDCLADLDQDLITIRDFIYDNPGQVTIDTICEKTEISRKVILHLINEGRLELHAPGSGGLLSCSICQRPIARGTMCDDCSNSLSSTLSSTLPKAEKKPLNADLLKRKSMGMHIRSNTKEEK